MLRRKRFCSLKPVELLTTKHHFSCLHGHQEAFSLFFPPSSPFPTAPSTSPALLLPAVRLVSETPSMRRRKRTAVGPMAKVCLRTSLGRGTRRKVTALPARRHQRSRGAAATGQVPAALPAGNKRARREPLQHLPPGRAMRAGSAGLPHLGAAANILGQRAGGRGAGRGGSGAAGTVPAAGAALAFNGRLAFLGARRANRRRRGRKRGAGAGRRRGQRRLWAGAGGRESRRSRRRRCRRRCRCCRRRCRAPPDGGAGGAAPGSAAWGRPASSHGACPSGPAGLPARCHLPLGGAAARPWGPAVPPTCGEPRLAPVPRPAGP